MPTATVNRVRLYYELHGESGEPLVLVHGYTGDVTDWQHQIPEFSPTHRLLVMDLRGHGRSEAPRDRSSYNAEQISDDVEVLVEQVGLERYHLLGHSMGGGIVQEIALRSPAKLLSLTLHATSCKFVIGGDPVMDEWREKRLALAETEGMAAVAELPPPDEPPPHMPADRLQEMKIRLAKMSADSFIGAWDGLLAWQGTIGRAQKITVPTLIIYGDLDMPGLIQGSKKLAELIPKARVEVIPEAGHSPQSERPELFNRALRHHLEANATRD